MAPFSILIVLSSVRVAATLVESAARAGLEVRLLTAAGLIASADATAERLGGHGQWLLALPPHHIAGLQVMLRSLQAGFEPVIVDVSSGFDPHTLPAAVAALRGPRRYTSLVPTQLLKALDHPPAAAALATLDAIDDPQRPAG